MRSGPTTRRRTPATRRGRRRRAGEVGEFAATPLRRMSVSRVGAAGEQRGTDGPRPAPYAATPAPHPVPARTNKLNPRAEQTPRRRGTKVKKVGSRFHPSRLF